MGLEFVVFMDSCVNKPKNKKSRGDQSFNVFLFCSCVHQAYTGISTNIFVYDVLLSILLKASFEMFCRESGRSTPPSKVRAPVDQVTFKLKLKTGCCLSSPKSIRYTKIHRNVSTWRGGLAKASSRLLAASGGNPGERLQIKTRHL